MYMVGTICPYGHAATAAQSRLSDQLVCNCVYVFVVVGLGGVKPIL